MGDLKAFQNERKTSLCLVLVFASMIIMQTLGVWFYPEFDSHILFFLGVHVSLSVAHHLSLKNAFQQNDKNFSPVHEKWNGSLTWTPCFFFSTSKIEFQPWFFPLSQALPCFFSCFFPKITLQSISRIK